VPRYKVTPVYFNLFDLKKIKYIYQNKTEYDKNILNNHKIINNILRRYTMLQKICIRKITICIASIITMVLLLTSAFGYQWSSLKGKGPVAIVSYSLYKSILQDGEEPGDAEPGIMQSREKYYAPYYECLNASWKQFNDSIKTVFPGTEFTAIDKIISNEQYKILTKPDFKKVFGKEVGVGSNFITAQGLNYVTNLPSERLDSICVALGVPIIMFIEIKASIEARTAAMGMGNGIMNIVYKIYCWEKGTGILIDDEVKTKSEVKAPLVMNRVKEKHWPGLILSAQANAFIEIRKLLKRFFKDDYK